MNGKGDRNRSLSQNYRDGWDRIFNGKITMNDPVTLLGGPFDRQVIERPPGHTIVKPIRLFSHDETWAIHARANYKYIGLTHAEFKSITLHGQGYHRTIQSKE